MRAASPERRATVAPDRSGRPIPYSPTPSPLPRRSDHVHNLAGDASLQKLDGLDTSLFSRAPPKAWPPTLILTLGAQGLGCTGSRAGRRACTPVRRAERSEGVLAALRSAAYHWHHARGRAAPAVALEPRCCMWCGGRAGFLGAA